MEGKELENNGQNNQKDISFNKLKKMSNEGIFMSVSKKAEKITTAIYMVTDLIPNNDPIKQKIREISLSMISDTRKMSYSLTGDLYFQLAKVIASAWEIVSIMEVAVVVGFISDMNYQILKNALIDFISDLRNKQRIEGFQKIQDMKFVQGGAGQISLKSDFFKLSDNDNERVIEETFKEEQPLVKNPIENNNIYRTFSNGHFDLTKMSVRKPEKIKEKKDRKGVVKINDRKERILDLVKEKKEIAMKDVISYFKEYSQKTVQRDLVSLTEEGKLRRSGEKRWSRYSPI